MKLRFAPLFLIIGISFLLFSEPAQAFEITDPQVIWQPDGGISPGDLTAKLTFNPYGTDALAITVENTSGDLDPDNYPATVSLTSFAFELPEGVSISGGEADLLANWYESDNPTIASDPDYIWGYNNTAEGPLANTPGVLFTNAIISTLEATHVTTFDLPSGNVDGPDGGIFDDEEDDPTNWNRYYGEALFYIDLLGIGDGYPGDIDDVLDYIENGNFVVSFGSPTAVTPEPATMLLLGSGLLGLAGFRRKFRKR